MHENLRASTGVLEAATECGKRFRSFSDFPDSFRALKLPRKYPGEPILGTRFVFACNQYVRDACGETRTHPLIRRQAASFWKPAAMSKIYAQGVAKDPAKQPNLLF